MLVLVLGAGLISTEWLEAAARANHRSARTEAALAAARDALLGYATSYPDQHSGRHGPGYLPCPDTNGNGSPNTPCGQRSLGRIPWRRLGLHEPRDGAGELLWYALADNFRANGHKHRPMNHETAAELELDGATGFAALILAPGAPLGEQARGAADRFDPAQYLEGGNETRLDAAYFSRAPGSPLDAATRFNDRILAISRDELMRAAGGRALAEVRTTLEAWRAAPWSAGALPWLVPWGGGTQQVLPTPGTVAGHLPLMPVGATFTTSLRIAGNPTGGTDTMSGTVDAAALALLPGALNAPAARCTWTAAAQIDCAGEERLVPGPGRERIVRFELHFSGDETIAPATATDLRRRAVRGREWTAASRFEIIDRAGGVETGRGERRFAPGPLGGTLEVAGVAHPPGVGEELPEWFLANEWHRSLLVAVAPAFAPGGAATCAGPGDCLTSIRATFDGRRDERPARAVLLLAGSALAHQWRDPLAPDLAAWFEGENANPANLRYETRHPESSFNDRTAVLP